MATVTIARGGGMAGMFVDVAVRATIDGKLIAKFYRHQALTFNVAPGHYMLGVSAYTTVREIPLYAKSGEHYTYHILYEPSVGFVLYRSYATNE